MGEKCYAPHLFARLLYGGTNTGEKPNRNGQRAGTSLAKAHSVREKQNVKLTVIGTTRKPVILIYYLFILIP